jgi:hypothetical protein
VYFEVFGRSYIVLNSVKSAKALLDQRSVIYSDRPRLVSFLAPVKTNIHFGSVGNGTTVLIFVRLESLVSLTLTTAGRGMTGPSSSSHIMIPGGSNAKSLPRSSLRVQFTGTMLSRKQKFNHW